MRNQTQCGVCEDIVVFSMLLFPLTMLVVFCLCVCLCGTVFAFFLGSQFVLECLVAVACRVLAPSRPKTAPVEYV